MERGHPPFLGGGIVYFYIYWPDFEIRVLYVFHNVICHCCQTVTREMGGGSVTLQSSCLLLKMLARFYF